MALRKILGLQPTPHLKLLRYVCRSATGKTFVRKRELEELLCSEHSFGPSKARDYVSLAKKIGLLKHDWSIADRGFTLLELNSLSGDDLRLSLDEKRFFIKILLYEDNECLFPLLRIIEQTPGITLDRLQDLFCQSVGFDHLKFGARRIKTLIRAKWAETLELVHEVKGSYNITAYGKKLLRLWPEERLDRIPEILYSNLIDQRKQIENNVPAVYWSLGEVIISYFNKAIETALKDKTGKLLERVLCDGYRLLGLRVKPLGQARVGKSVPDSLVYWPEDTRYGTCLVNDAKNIPHYGIPKEDEDKMVRYCDYAYDMIGAKTYGVFFAPSFLYKTLKRAEQMAFKSKAERILLLSVRGFSRLIQDAWRLKEEGVFLQPRAILSILTSAKYIIEESYVTKELKTRTEFRI